MSVLSERSFGQSAEQDQLCYLVIYLHGVSRLELSGSSTTREQMNRKTGKTR